MSDEPLPQSEIILHQTEDRRTRVQCRFEDETLWLTQAEIAELFETPPQKVTLPLKSIFAEGVEQATSRHDSPPRATPHRRINPHHLDSRRA